jgi:hypothetical protein
VPKQAKTSIRLVAAIVLLLVLASCASNPSLSPGIYTTTITEEEVLTNDELGPVERGYLPFKWELTLADEDRYSFSVYWSNSGFETEEGRYTLTEDQIVFAAEKLYGYCPKLETSTYKWAFDGKALTLTTIEDECNARRFVNSIHPWSRQD